MTLKNMVPVLFILAFVLIAVSIAVLPSGWLKQTVLFLGVVAAIAGMMMKIAQLLKSK